jgi:hypothetical protein
LTAKATGLATKATGLATKPALRTASGRQGISIRCSGLRLRRIARIPDQQKSENTDANQPNPDI